MFCYFVCVMPYIVVLARRVGDETKLQERNRLMYEVINNEVTESYVMNSEVSTSSVCSDEVSSLSHVWFCDVDSPIPSWDRHRRERVTFSKDSPKTRLTYLHCIFSVLLLRLFSIMYLLLFVVSALGFSSGRVPRSVVACRSGMCVW